MTVFRKIFTTLTGMLFIVNMNAQQLHTKWTISTKKVSDCEYDVIFSVKIDPKWHLYSSVPSVPKEKGGPVPNATDIKFTPGTTYQLVGSLKESTPKKVYDEIFEADVRFFENSATFTQRVKATKSGQLEITGTYKYEACAEVCEFSPKQKFSVSITIPASAPCLTSSTARQVQTDATTIAKSATASILDALTQKDSSGTSIGSGETNRKTSTGDEFIPWKILVRTPGSCKELVACTSSIV